MRIIWLVCLVVSFCVSCSASPALKDVTHCGPPLARDSLVQIVVTNLEIDRSKYTFDISEKGCKYYVTAYLIGGPPDSQVFFIISRNGEIKERIFGG